MNHVRVLPGSIVFQNVVGFAVRTSAISCIWDNGEEIVVAVDGKGMPISLSYAEAQRTFAGWSEIKILGGRKK